MPHQDHYCSAGYRATKTDMILGEENQEAIEILTNVGLKYVLINLGLESSINRLIARMRGVNSTHTLIYKGQTLKGLQQIASALETTVKP